MGSWGIVYKVLVYEDMHNNNKKTINNQFFISGSQCEKNEHVFERPVVLSEYTHLTSRLSSYTSISMYYLSNIKKKSGKNSFSLIKNINIL